MAGKASIDDERSSLLVSEQINVNHSGAVPTSTSTRLFQELATRERNLWGRYALRTGERHDREGKLKLRQKAEASIFEYKAILDKKGARENGS